MTQFTCNWHKNHMKSACPYRATQVILFGCLQGHINETLFCYQHSIDWQNQYRTQEGYGCLHPGCHQKLQDYEIIMMSRVKNIRDFQQRHINSMVTN